MTIDELVGWLQKNNIGFFHFTDERNLPSIQQHGLLSMSELKRRGLAIEAPGGNEWSFNADIQFGMDKYVHLCFRKSQPMLYHAKKDGRIVNARILKILPEIVALPGVLVCDEVSNQAGTVPEPPLDIMGRLDWAVMYNRVEYRDPEIQKRLKAAERYEILVPNNIPLQFIRNI